ncbi:MAG: sigma-70 family RNA polymerase sigma factor [Bacteroidota bacterium]
MFRKRSLHTDDHLISQIQKGGIARQRAINHIHDTYSGFVVKGKRKYRLEQEEVIDAYSESIVGMSKQIEVGKFRGESKLSTYLYQIFCNKCIDRVRHNSADKNQVEWIHDMPDMPDMAKDIVKDITEQEDRNKLVQYLSLVGEKCKQILWESEYQGFSLQEIADRMGFQRAQSVANQKHKCMAKLKQLIRSGAIVGSI